MPNRSFRRSTLTAFALCALAVNHADATAIFTLDTPNTFLTLSGNVGGLPITQQGPGSLRTTYSGDLAVNLTGSSIEIVGGNADANISGSWQPLPDGTLGSAPADYGGKFKVLVFFDAFFAIRGLILEASSAPLTLAPDGTFDSMGVDFTIVEGDVAYNAAILSQMGSQSLAGNSGANQAASPSSLTIIRNATGADAVLFIPAEGTFTVVDPTLGTVVLDFSGQTRALVSTINGDANFDRVVNIADFATVAANFNLPGGWLDGDFDGDGSVGIGDFSLLAANFNQSAPSARAAVPEPALAPGLLVAAGLRRRRSGLGSHRVYRV